MPNSPFVQRNDLTAIAIAYRNNNYIADEIYPYVSIFERGFEWDQFELDTYFNVVSDEVGPTGRPNELRWAATRQSGRVIDRALDSPVPFADRETDSGRLLNPELVATTLVSEIVALNREKRAADLTFDSANYLISQRLTLSGSSQWSDTSSNPIAAISDALDVPVFRPNMIVFGAETWKHVSRHPKIVEATVGTGAQYGIARHQQVAELFEVDKVLVGRARSNSAAPGQPPTLVRLWGKHCALLYNNPLSRATTDVPPTWGMTARLGDRVAGTIPDPDMGMLGGMRVRAGESVSEFIASKNCGYLLQNAVA